MDSQTKICQNCKKDFVIEPDDFAFYEKIKVPAPTWCPECRLQRRLSFRNERILYKRACDLCGDKVISIYRPGNENLMYCHQCCWSDKWDPLEYGQDYDFSRPFFEQFQQLQSKVPRIALLTKNSVNSEYTNHSNNNKNCYLSVAVFNSENVMYSSEVTSASHDVCDCFWIANGGQLIYELVDSNRCYQCQYSLLLRNCNSCLYCYDCRGCSYCFLSSNLRNKKYYFLNKPHTKEEYFQKIAEYNLGSFKERAKLFGSYLDLIKNKTIHRFATIENSKNVSGDMISNSKNTFYAFDAYDSENTKYSVVSEDAKDSMDSFCYGFHSELIYETHATIHSYNIMFTHLCYDNSDTQYCDTCQNGQNLFGCVGVKSGSYIIFNKKYFESEYETLKEKIIEHMNKTGEYGEFFPPQLSPFGYNETEGQIYMPFAKEEALARGYKWENLVPGTFGKETMASDQISDDIKNVKDTILKEALRCEKCGKNYNIIKSELDFYRRENIPIPRMCPDCRYKNRIAMRPPRKLWHRQCMCDKDHPHHNGKCPNEFETSYSPDRPEIVYCEQCYQQEVA